MTQMDDLSSGARDDNREKLPAAVSYSVDAPRAAAPPPWLLRPYFDGGFPLDKELATRFPNMPLLSAVHFRAPDRTTGYGLAMLATQDGAATVSVEVDRPSGDVQWRFTAASMLTLRFHIAGLSELDREHWLDKMRLGDGRVAFLWSETRWSGDYLICAAHRYYSNIFAFSTTGAEAAARLTPDVTGKLLDWLHGFWTPPRAEEPDSGAAKW
jgi:hypothetical protein